MAITLKLDISIRDSHLKILAVLIAISIHCSILINALNSQDLLTEPSDHKHLPLQV